MRGLHLHLGSALARRSTRGCTLPLSTSFFSTLTMLPYESFTCASHAPAAVGVGAQAKRPFRPPPGIPSLYRGIAAPVPVPVRVRALVREV